MCGIYGSTEVYSDETIRLKLSAINFRGPDFSGIDKANDVIFGHNRLSIMDLDSRSNQPFTYHGVKIVFNGEIYNYKDIKSVLEKKGYCFQTTSDTEVICAAYLEYGSKCVELFNGMFAFAIYDHSRRLIFAARDRLGKKPFYYFHSSKKFEFASQPSQIKIGRKISYEEQSISDYLIWGYVPEPKSIWQNIKQLRAGCYLKFYLESGDLKISKYWDLYSEDEHREFEGDYHTAKTSLKTLLKDAVSIRMNADVPLGVFLSGGIDSSLIAALASEKKNGEKIKTFSIKFNENGFDESIYAEQVANRLGTNHQTIECNYEEGIDLIRNFSAYYDEPFSDSSAIPSMLLSKYTRKQVTVALSGDGGDEAFVGYARYNWINLMHHLFKLPLPIRKSLGNIISLSPYYVHKLIGLGLSVKDIQTLYIRMLGGLENSWIENPEKGLATYFDYIFHDNSKTILEKVSDFDIKTYLNGDINTKVDRASMAFSLEARAPIMDYRVIEFSRSLPINYKYRNGTQKRILKDILYEYLPQNLFDRPKSGFTMPFKEWFRKELKSYVLENLSKSELDKIPGINVPKTQKMIKEHMDGTWNRYTQIWKLLVLSQWMKKHH